MSILVDTQIREMSTRGFFSSAMQLIEHGFGMVSEPLPKLLEPFSEGVQGNGVISYGLSHAGYDLRLGHKVLVFKNTRNALIDPKEVKKCHDHIFDTIEGIKEGERVIIPPNSYILGYSLEYIRMPDYLKGTCVGKSTLARCGVLVNTTPLEPGWHGHLTIEIANVTPCPVAIYCGEGIAQLEFHVLHTLPGKNYAQKGAGGTGGKYQGQGAAPIPAKVVE